MEQIFVDLIILSSTGACQGRVNLATRGRKLEGDLRVTVREFVSLGPCDGGGTERRDCFLKGVEILVGAAKSSANHVFQKWTTTYRRSFPPRSPLVMPSTTCACQKIRDLTNKSTPFPWPVPTDDTEAMLQRVNTWLIVASCMTCA